MKNYINSLDAHVRVIDYVGNFISEELDYYSDRGLELGILFARALENQAVLSNVWPQFAVYLLIDKNYGAIKCTKLRKQRALIREIAELYKNYNSTNAGEWEAINKNADNLGDEVYDLSFDRADGEIIICVADFLARISSVPYFLLGVNEHDFAEESAAQALDALAEAVARYAETHKISSFYDAEHAAYAAYTEKLVQLLRSCGHTSSAVKD